MSAEEKKPTDAERTLEQRLESVLRTIYDPEIPVDIYELGLVYELHATPAGRVDVLMTLTSPHCPVAESLPIEVKRKLLDVQGVREVDVKITWDPPWGPERMSEAAKLQLGLV